MNEVLDYLNRINFEIKYEHRTRSGPQKVGDCPLCGAITDMRQNKKRFHINGDTGVWQCYECKETGNLISLKRILGDLNEPAPVFSKFGTKRDAQLRITQEPKGKVIDYEKVDKMHKDLLKHEAGMKYLKEDRKLTAKSIKKYKLGITKKRGQDYIAIPYFKSGKCVLIKYRSLEGKDFQREAGCESEIFNIDLANASDFSSLIMCESEIDAISMHQYGFEPVVAASAGAGSLPQEWREELALFDEINFCYDSDDAGTEGANKAAEFFGKHRCRRIDLPHKDVNECLKNDISVEILSALIENAHDYNLTKIVHISEVIREARDTMSKEDIYGIPTGFRDWDDIIKGYRPGELLIWTGETGSGKSTFANYQLLKLAREDHGVLLGSFENTKLQTGIKIIQMESGRNYEDLEENDELYNEAFNRIITYPYYMIDAWGIQSMDDLSHSIDMGIRKYGLKVTLIDNLDFLVQAKSQSDESYQIKNILKALKRIAENLNTVVMLVAHPKVINIDDQGQGRLVDINDLRGSSAIKQWADGIFRVARKRDLLRSETTKDYSMLTNLKGRSDFSEERSTILSFDRKSCVYSNYDPKDGENSTDELVKDFISDTGNATNSKVNVPEKGYRN